MNALLFLLTLSSPANLHKPHDLPDPPALLARERERAAVGTVELHNVLYPLYPATQCFLDDEPVSLTEFMAGVKQVTVIKVEDGWVTQLSGLSKSKQPLK